LKEVEWIKVQPFEYTAKVSGDGSVATLESYIHILSSQNENALFRIRIRAQFPRGANNKKAQKPEAPEQPDLEVLSDPIQVISKPSVLRRKHERERAKHDELVKSSPLHAPSTVKRSRDDVIIETLNDIRCQQEAQQRLLERLAATPSASPSSPRSPAYSSPTGSDPAASAHSTPLLGLEENFELAFQVCVRAYNNLDRESRTGKLRKVIREAGSTGVAFVEAAWSEAFQGEIDAQVGRLADSSLWRQSSSNNAAAAWRETPAAGDSDLEEVTGMCA